MACMWLKLRAACAASIILLLAGCASPYGQATLFGGFSESKLSDNSWRIAYSGNGHTTEDMVVKYWLHRCAELTLKEGFAYFTMVPGSDKAGAAPGGDPAWTALAAGPGDDSPFVRVKGGSAPVYIWVPSGGGGGATRYSKRGVILMYRTRIGATTPEHAYSLHAGTVTSMLKQFVESQGKESGPDRREVIDAAIKFGRAGV